MPEPQTEGLPISSSTEAATIKQGSSTVPNGVTPHGPSEHPVDQIHPPAVARTYLLQQLEDAELLLNYCAELGIVVEKELRAKVLNARTAWNAGALKDDLAANLLDSLTALAARVRPVTVQSLRTWEKSDVEGDRRTLRVYGISAFVIGLVVLFISLITFVSSRVSESIKADVDTANALAAKLALELGPPPSTTEEPDAGTNALQTSPLQSANTSPSDVTWFGPSGPPRGVTAKDVILDLQKFAATMRNIDRNSRQLNHFVANAAYVPFSNLRTNWGVLRTKFELTPGLPLLLSRELTEKIQVYQEIRNFANTVLAMTSVYYGAIATCMLPVLYALLGAAAYLLRLDYDQVRDRTFISPDKHVARFLTAGIGGLVVGQFNVTPGVAISPFAVAFLVGYAVDLFFAFLDGLLQIFKRSPGRGPQGLGAQEK
jgi:hypothetical protein